MERDHCRNCAHYVQHYGLGEERFYRLNCGHCMRYRRKQKKPDSPICEQFEKGLTDAERFVTKAYLSKELLQFVLGLELLPDMD